MLLKVSAFGSVILSGEVKEYCTSAMITLSPAASKAGRESR